MLKRPASSGCEGPQVQEGANEACHAGIVAKKGKICRNIVKSDSMSNVGHMRRHAEGGMFAQFGHFLERRHWMLIIADVMGFNLAARCGPRWIATIACCCPSAAWRRH